MPTKGTPESELVANALAWVRRSQNAICDRIEPWEHGTVYRASRYPGYFDFNTVVVKDEPSLGVRELVEVADRALRGLGHRRIDFDFADAAEPLRAGFSAMGFQATRLVWMRFQGPRPREARTAVSEVADDAVTALRAAWHEEDFPSDDTSRFLAHAREVRLALGSRTLAVHDDSRPVGFAALDLAPGQAEIGAVYVLPEYRGRGLGATLTKAAIEAVGQAAHLWICADDEGRPKHLYTRLGFRPITTTMEFLRPPEEQTAD